MKKVFKTCCLGLLVPLFTGVFCLPVWARESDVTAKTPWAASEDWFVYAIIILVLGGALWALLLIRSALRDSDWSLAYALSEEAELTVMKMDEDGNEVPLLDSAGNPVSSKKMCASSSRMIALMGMLSILMLFLGFGSFALFSFAKTGELPESMERVVQFLMAGLTLFAPYLVNKFSGVFSTLSTKK